MSDCAVGVDWSNGSWLAIGLDDRGSIKINTADEIGAIWEQYHDSAARIVFDIPIGLFEEDDDLGDSPRSRECDQLARDVVGSRYPSVFNPPARDAVEMAQEDSTAYSTVSDCNRQCTGKGLSQQAYYISDGIAAIDQVLRGNAGWERPTDPDLLHTFVEGHPEVCFRALAGEPLEHSKTTAPGVGERLNALATEMSDPAETLHSICTELATADHTDIDIDDVLDALVLAVTADANDSELHRLPGDAPPTDAQDLPMQMVYRAPEPIHL